MYMSFGTPRVWFELQFVEHGCKDAGAIVLDIIAGAAQCKCNHPKQVRRHPSKPHCCLQGRSNHPGDVPRCARSLSSWTYLQVDRRRCGFWTEGQAPNMGVAMSLALLHTPTAPALLCERKLGWNSCRSLNSFPVACSESGNVCLYSMLRHTFGVYTACLQSVRRNKPTVHTLCG